MSLTTRIQDQKDHITQVKKDLCSKVGIPSEPLPSFSEIMGSVPSPSLSDIIKFDIPETYQDGISYNFQAFNRPWVKICGPNQLITEINYTSSRNYFTLLRGKMVQQIIGLPLYRITLVKSIKYSQKRNTE